VATATAHRVKRTNGRNPFEAGRTACRDPAQQEAAQALQAAGYVLGRVATVVDLTGEFLGEVKTQSPAAGTIDPPGTSVSVTIGKAGGKCLSDRRPGQASRRGGGMAEVTRGWRRVSSW
jgi:hypothetical protein